MTTIGIDIGAPSAYPWGVAEYLPCGVVRLGGHRGCLVWRTKQQAEEWATYCMDCEPCIFRRAVPLPIVGTR